MKIARETKLTGIDVVVRSVRALRIIQALGGFIRPSSRLVRVSVKIRNLIRISEIFRSAILVQLITGLIIVGTTLVSTAILRVFAHRTRLVRVLSHLFAVYRGCVVYLFLPIRYRSLLGLAGISVFARLHARGTIVSSIEIRAFGVRARSRMPGVIVLLPLVRLPEGAGFCVRIYLLARLLHVGALLVLAISFRVLTYHTHHGIFHDLVARFSLIFVRGRHVVRGFGEIFVGETIRISRLSVIVLLLPQVGSTRQITW